MVLIPLVNGLNAMISYLQVIGVFQPDKSASSNRNSEPGNQNLALSTVLAPYQTLLSRFSNDANSAQSTEHSSQCIIVHFSNPSQIPQSEKIIERLLLRRHNNIKDFKIINPLLNLNKNTRNKRITILVFFLATIFCLFSSGIAVLNHITASAYERCNEILLQLSKNISHNDILLQFMFQSVIICSFGALLGIILGIISAEIFYNYTKFIMIVSFSSILISFAVSVLIGIIFSYFPARKIINNL